MYSISEAIYFKILEYSKTISPSQKQLFNRGWRTISLFVLRSSIVALLFSNSLCVRAMELNSIVPALKENCTTVRSDNVMFRFYQFYKIQKNLGLSSIVSESKPTYSKKRKNIFIIILIFNEKFRRTAFPKIINYIKLNR